MLLTSFLPVEWAEQITKAIAIFVLAPLILYKGFVYQDLTLGLIGALMLVYDGYWALRYRRMRRLRTAAHTATSTTALPTIHDPSKNADDVSVPSAAAAEDGASTAAQTAAAEDGASTAAQTAAVEGAPVADTSNSASLGCT